MKFRFLPALAVLVIFASVLNLLIGISPLVASGTIPSMNVMIAKLAVNKTGARPEAEVADSRRRDPPTTSILNDNTIAACLLIKDDNNRLPEWLAYHYHVMPLRSLIVGVDVNSVTSPQEILRVWNQTTDMDIQLWQLDNLVPPDIAKKEKTHVVERQTYFLSACFQHLKKVHSKNHASTKTWVTSHDVDEFITFNRFTLDDPHWKVRNETLLRYNQQTNRDMSLQDHLVVARTRLPAQTGVDVRIADFIASEQTMPPWNYQSCVPMTRLQFGGRRSSVDDVQMSGGFDATKLDTLRFRQHREKGKCASNCKGKVLLDLSRIPDDHLVHSRKGGVSHFGPHDPIVECNKTLIPNYLHSVLRVQHYLGSKEAFFAKHDPRRTNKKFNWYKNLKSVPEMEATHWFKSFVDSMGEEKAQALLKGAGEIDADLFEKYSAMEKKDDNKGKPDSPAPVPLVGNNSTT